MNYRIEPIEFLSLTHYNWPFNGDCMLLNGSSKFLGLTKFINASNLRGLKLKTKTKEQHKEAKYSFVKQ